jgi:hypothetical protein
VEAAAAAAAAAQGDVSLETGDGATILNAKLGVKRPKKVKRDPVERQNMVADALRIATEGEAVPGYKANSSSSSSSGQKPWWQEQFQAVFLPSIRYGAGVDGLCCHDGCAMDTFWNSQGGSTSVVRDAVRKPT